MATVPYASTPYDDRAYQRSMADLIGERGRVAANYELAKGASTAGLIGGLADIAGSAVANIGQYHYQQQQQAKKDAAAQGLKDAYRLGAGQSPDEQVRILQQMGYGKEARYLSESNDRHALTTIQLDRERMQLADQKVDQAVNLWAGVEDLPTPEEKFAAWPQVRDRIKELVGKDHAALVPEYYD